MDDPDSSWPAWKFGMKREDLFTTLHDQYNTFTYTLQDPEAFHHDVFEIARNADTVEELHRFLADRQRQRLTELHESLESLAVEIIANPKLIGSDQWQHALQLFRTKSFDSIVRYFASYLPEGYLERHESSSFSDADYIRPTTSTKASRANRTLPSYIVHDFFPNGPIMTTEPCSMDDDDESEMALSSRSEPHGSTTSSSSSRFTSFSVSESGRLGSECSRRSLIHDDDQTSQSDDGDTAVTSLCDSAETRSSFDPTDVDVKELPAHIVYADEEGDDEFPTAQYPEDDICSFDTFYDDALDSFSTTTYDTLEPDTPAPRRMPEAACYLDYKSATRKSPQPHCRAHRRSPSPRYRLGQRRAGDLLRGIRRSPEETLSKIQKQPPLADSTWKKSQRRRWLV